MCSELAAYHAASKGTTEAAHATYLLTGEVASSKIPHGFSTQGKDGMDVDMDAVEDHDKEQDGDTVPITKVLLAGENDLESEPLLFKNQPQSWTHIHMLHRREISVYSNFFSACLQPIAISIGCEH